METMVETVPSMESMVLVESMPSAASMMPMRAMASVESMPSAMTVSSPVSTSGPDIIDHTRPAKQGQHREQIAHKLVHASIDPWTVMSTGPHIPAYPTI
ncbi:MAG: hypothetical protein ACREXK_03390 [Gammaproteobacteria bacterium]